MGGAFAGIMGVSGADNQILTKLKRTAVAYANEYSRPSPDKAELNKLSGDMYGCLQTLQLTYTLTEKEAMSLTDELQILDSELT